MTDEEQVKKAFVEFIYSQLDNVDQGTPGDNARFVTATVFDVIVKTWEDVHGPQKMAEYFYQIADALVERSNLENLF